MRKLGIIAGNGRMPALIAEECKKHNRPYFVLGLEGHTEASLLEGAPHKVVRLGAVGDALKCLKKEKVDDVIMAGSVGRPTLSSLRPDMTATMWLARLGSSIFSGDDALLSAIVSIMEKEGFEVIGMKDVLSHLVTTKGTLGKIKPAKQHQQDIERGLKVAHALGTLDVGQAAVVENNYVLALEAAEGTEGMLARIAKLPQHEQGSGVLVKAKKPSQDPRADLPTIGTDTVKQAHKAGLAGIAVEAGGSIILDKEKVISLADEHGLFVCGV